MKFSFEIISKEAINYQGVGYFCESFEQLPIAITLLEHLPGLRVYSTSESVTEFLHSINVNVHKLSLVDITGFKNPWDLMRAIALLRRQAAQACDLLKNTYLLTSSARVSVSLFYLFDLRKEGISFVGWSDVDWINGEMFARKPSQLSWKSYLFLKIRYIAYKNFISKNIALKLFSGEIFIAYTGEFKSCLRIPERSSRIERFHVAASAKAELPHGKTIIFLLGQSYDNDCIFYGKDRVEAVFRLMQIYKHKIILKIHPGVTKQDYFHGKPSLANAIDSYDKNIPIEVLANHTSIIASFGSTALVNTSMLGIRSICLGRIGEFTLGNLDNYFYQHFETASKDYFQEFRSVSELIGLFEQSK